MMVTWRKRGCWGGTWRVALLKAETAAAILRAVMCPPTALKRSTRGSFCRGIFEQVGWTDAREIELRTVVGVSPPRPGPRTA
jgi:hypothetical protein